MKIGDVYTHKITHLAILINEIYENTASVKLTLSGKHWLNISINIIKQYYEFNEKFTNEQTIKSIIE